MATPPAGSWQELGEEFHLMIGECVAGWAHVDDELFRIFHHCVGPLVQCSIIYYRTPGLDVRFALVDEIVGSVLPKRERRSGGHDHPSVKAWKTAKAVINRCFEFGGGSPIIPCKSDTFSHATMEMRHHHRGLKFM